jgi:hypothetical protein
VRKARRRKAKRVRIAQRRGSRYGKEGAKAKGNQGEEDLKVNSLL